MKLSTNAHFVRIEKFLFFAVNDGEVNFATRTYF